MNNTRLLSLLKQLSKKELEQFNDFLNSPFFNKNKKIVHLWKIIKPYDLDFSHEELKNYNTYEALQMKEQSIENLFRETTKLLNQFLIQIRFKEEIYFQKHLLLDELRRKAAIKLYQSNYKSTKRQLENVLVKGNQYYLQKFMLDYNYADFVSQNSADNRVKIDALNRSIKSLDVFYVQEKMMQSSELENLKRLAKTEEIYPDLLAELQHKIEKGWLNDYPLVNILHQVLKLVIDDEETPFKIAQELLEQHKSKIPKQELFTIYTLLGNFCIRMIRQAKEEYAEHLFKIYEQTIRQAIIHTNPYISPDRLRNMVIIGCRLELFEETRELIMEFKSNLNPIHRESVYHFNLGLVAYYEKTGGDYEKAKFELSKFPNQKNIYTFESERTLIKIHYEEKEIHAFWYLLPSFKSRVKNSKILGRVRQANYSNFCKIIHRMFKLKTEPNYKRSVESLRTMLDGFEKVSDRNWLKEKLNELDKGRN